jgi:hypothetical protein
MLFPGSLLFATNPHDKYYHKAELLDQFTLGGREARTRSGRTQPTLPSTNPPLAGGPAWLPSWRWTAASSSAPCDTRVPDTHTLSDWRRLEFPWPNGGCLATLLIRLSDFAAAIRGAEFPC